MQYTMINSNELGIKDKHGKSQVHTRARTDNQKWRETVGTCNNTGTDNSPAPSLVVDLALRHNSRLLE
jgi:hypothetical protein